jgi:Tfp pilus assembly protein PilN
MPHDLDPRETDDVSRLLASLPRSAPMTPGEADRLVARLYQEGILRRRPSRLLWALVGAAAVLLFAAGALVGARYTRQSSLEAMLTRQDLTLSDRVLLLERAGSVYVRAARSYADATANKKPIIWF